MHVFIRPKPIWDLPLVTLVTLDNLGPTACSYGNNTFEYLPYQLLKILPGPNMVTMGNEGSTLKRDPGKTGTTSKGGSRCANYILPVQGDSDKNNNTGLFQGHVIGMSTL